MKLHVRNRSTTRYGNNLVISVTDVTQVTHLFIDKTREPIWYLTLTYTSTREKKEVKGAKV